MEMDTLIEEVDQPHMLDLVGTGFFSKGKCTGCSWRMSGHAEDISRGWTTYHEENSTFTAPERVEIPPASIDPLAAEIERRIITVLTHHVDFNNQAALYVAWGLAEARAMRLNESLQTAMHYVSTMLARVANMSKHQRSKLRQRHNRAEMQTILEVR